MIRMTLKQLNTVLSGQIVNNKDKDIEFAGISIDSRTIQPHNLFFAIKGENLDGHDFVAQAAENGASAAVVNHPLQLDLPMIVVNDVTHALGQTAHYWRQQFTLPIIAVTGSNGKTTTKNMLHAIFVQANQNNSKSVLATQGNLNNHWGLPLILCRLSAQNQIAIIEMGMNHFGEIEYLTKLAKPTTALITNVAPAHLQGVGGTIEGVAKAKGEIFAGLDNQGIAVINADDAFANYWLELNQQRRCITFGMENSSVDVRGEISPKGFKLHHNGKRVEIQLRLLGRHNIMNALAASAAAIANNVKLLDIQSALENLLPAPGRLETKTGKSGVIVIDDTYNANPASLKAAVHAIAQQPGTKILVLGDMRELGEQGAELHTESGKMIQAAGIDYLFAVGELTAFTAKAFGRQAQHFTDQASLIDALSNYMKPNTTILVKGSRSMKMENVVKALVTKNQ